MNKIIKPEEIIKRPIGLRVIATQHTCKTTGDKYCTYRCVANPKKKLMNLKFTRACGFPARALADQGVFRFVLINPRYNVDFNNLYPTVWVTAFEEYSTAFEDFKDTLTIVK